jgi:hypothetical protein
MLDKTPQADRILVAQLHGEAQRHARRGEMDDDEHQAAVDELRKLAGGRADLLGHVAGIELGFGEGSRASRCPAGSVLCRKAGADEAAIAGWVEVGRQRRADARRFPLSGGLRSPVRHRRATVENQAESHRPASPFPQDG